MAFTDTLFFFSFEQCDHEIVKYTCTRFEDVHRDREREGESVCYNNEEEAVEQPVKSTVPVLGLWSIIYLIVIIIFFCTSSQLMPITKGESKESVFI